MNKLEKVYKAIEAVSLMGIACSSSSVDKYICNMKSEGLLKASYKLNNRWCISESDIIYIRERIMNGEYCPTTKHFKKAA